MNSIFLLGGAALLSASTVLLFLLCRQARYLRSMDRTLSAILEGNRNLRVRFPGSLKGLGGVETRINGLAELLQRAEDQGRELEAGRRRFMTNISHDLRTPLTALLGYAELLEGLADGEVESRERYRRKIREKGEQLSSLMERFFSLSLMESGEYPLHPESLDLWEQLRRSLLEFALPLGELGIEPEVHLPPEPLMIRADGAALGRILENLFSNVCRYTPRGGSLKVEGFRRDSRGVVRITNSGEEIPREFLPLLFERLYTAQAARGKGHGLGLSIVRALVESMGGQVGADSGPGWISFSFELPAS